MNPADAMQLSQSALSTTLIISTPAVAAALLIGTLVAFAQAITQVQEMTLAFAPKIVAVLLVLMLAAPFLGSQITNFAVESWGRIETIR